VEVSQMDRPNLPGPENENTRPSADLPGTTAMMQQRVSPMKKPLEKVLKRGNALAHP